MPLPPWKHLVVVDLEATCDDAGRVPKREMEIIEIGAVLVSADDFVQISEFESFVRPVRHPILTPFCKTLTTISQEDVDNAPVFPEVAQTLKKWLYRYEQVVFGSWGEYDKRQLQQDCEFHGIPNPLPRSHVNLKELFRLAQGAKKRLGMAEALRHVGLQLEGTHHRGIDDARNIARLVPFCVPAIGSRSN